MISRFLCLGNLPAERPLTPGLFAFARHRLARIAADWRQDLADFWHDRLRLPTLEECEQDIECPDCGRLMIYCRCGGCDA